MGISDNYGMIAVGQYADFIVIQENPNDNIKAIQEKDKWVFQHGQPVVFHQEENIIS